MRVLASIITIVALVFAVTAPLGAETVEWPPKQPIKFIVPTAAGGGSDTLARLFGPRLQPVIGASFVVENRPGGSGNIGTTAVKNAPANGTVFLVTQGAHTSNVAFFKSRYDPVKDFQPVAFIGPTNFVVCVQESSALRTMGDLVALVKERRDQVTYGSGGFASSSHLAMELFQTMSGLKLIHVPFPGTTPSVMAVLGGVVDFIVAAENAMRPLVTSGQVRCLAATGARRATLFPELPTIAEAMPLPGYHIEAWFGILGPAGLPHSIVDVMNREVNRILRDPEFVKKHLALLGIVPEPTTPEIFRQRLETEVARYRKLASEANIELKN